MNSIFQQTSLDNLNSQSLIQKKNNHDGGKQHQQGNNNKNNFSKNINNFKNLNINANAKNKVLKNMNHKQLLLDANKRMLNRNQFVQNTKITIHPIFGVPDNYSFN